MVIEKKPIQYLDIHAHKYKQYKFGVMWFFMANKFLNFAEILGITDFKASTCSESATLQRNNKVGINSHGEENFMTDEERQIIN